MALKDVSHIDRAVLGTKDILLVIEDDFTWEDEYAHLLALQSKVNRYLEFAEDGEMYREYPGSEGLPVRIRVYFTAEPTENGKQFFKVANEVLENSPIRVEYEKKPSL